MDISGSLTQKPVLTPDNSKLWETAKKLEAGFLTEMLKYTGLGETSESFGGGAGEDNFTSFLTREQATLMTEAGGIGLAEILFKSLAGRQE